MLISEFIFECIRLLQANTSPNNRLAIKKLENRLFYSTSRAYDNNRFLDELKTWELSHTDKVSLKEHYKAVDFNPSEEEMYFETCIRYYETSLCLSLLLKPLPGMMAVLAELSRNIVRMLEKSDKTLSHDESVNFLDRVSKQHFVPGRLSANVTMQEVSQLLRKNEVSDFYRIMNIHLLFADVFMRHLVECPAWIHKPKINTKLGGARFDTTQKICDLMNVVLYKSPIFEDRGRILQADNRYQAPLDQHFNQNNGYSSLQGIVLEYSREMPVADHRWRQDRFYTTPDYNSTYVKRSLSKRIPYVAGPSGLMTLLMPLALLVGQLDTAKKLHHYILCCCVYMVCGGLHSCYETLITTEDKLGLLSLHQVDFLVGGSWKQSVGRFFESFETDSDFSAHQESSIRKLVAYGVSRDGENTLSLRKKNDYVLTISDNQVFDLMPIQALYSFNYIKESLLARVSAEWQLWSKCLGKIVVINGASSCGKSTLARQAVQYGYVIVSYDDTCEELLFEYLHETLPAELINQAKILLTIDDFRKIWCGYKLELNRYDIQQQQVIKLLQKSIVLSREYPSYEFICDRMWTHAIRSVYGGRNVMVDTVILDQRQLAQFHCYFNNSTYLLGLLYASLSDNLRNCFDRNRLSTMQNRCDYRSPEMIVSHYLQLYQHISESEVSVQSTTFLAHVDKPELRSQLNKLNQNILDLQSALYGNQSQLQVLRKSIASIIKEIMSKLTLKNNKNVYALPRLKHDFIIGSPACFFNGSPINNNDSAGKERAGISLRNAF